MFHNFLVYIERDIPHSNKLKENTQNNWIAKQRKTKLFTSNDQQTFYECISFQSTLHIDICTSYLVQQVLSIVTTSIMKKHCIPINDSVWSCNCFNSSNQLLAENFLLFIFNSPSSPTKIVSNFYIITVLIIPIWVVFFFFRFLLSFSTSFLLVR